MLVYFTIFFAACMAAALSGATFPPGNWYQTLDKPSWTPPNWVFPTAWTSIYLLISWAAARVALSADTNTSAPVVLGLAFWALQIALNTLWTPVFFGIRRLGAAFVISLFLTASVVATMYAFWQVDWIAGLMVLPYVAWMCAATALNLSVWMRNPRVEPIDFND